MPAIVSRGIGRGLALQETEALAKVNNKRKRKGKQGLRAYLEQASGTTRHIVSWMLRRS